MPNPTISLEAIAVPASPLSIGSAAAKSFANNYEKMTEYGVPSLRDQKTISILGLTYELAHAGGTDYRLNHTQMIQDAVTFSGGISNLDFNGAMAALDWNAGFTADATLPTDIPTLFGLARRVTQLSELQLNQIIVLLRAKLRT